MKALKNENFFLFQKFQTKKSTAAKITSSSSLPLYFKFHLKKLRKFFNQIFVFNKSTIEP